MLQENTEILNKAKSGNVKAQLAIYDQYYKAVFNSCYRILLNKEDAEDITHDSFIVAFDKNTLIPEKSNTVAWLRKVGINKSIDFLRRQQKLIINNDIKNELESEEAEEYEKDQYSKYNARKIYDSINQLPKQYQLVLNLFLIEGYDHSEISEILKISSSTSRSQLTRAKRKLKDILSYG